MLQESIGANYSSCLRAVESVESGAIVGCVSCFAVRGDTIYSIQRFTSEASRPETEERKKLCVLSVSAVHPYSDYIAEALRAQAIARTRSGSF